MKCWRIWDKFRLCARDLPWTYSDARSIATLLQSYEATKQHAYWAQTSWLYYIAKKPSWTVTYIYKHLKIHYSLPKHSLHSRGPDAVILHCTLNAMDALLNGWSHQGLPACSTLIPILNSVKNTCVQYLSSLWELRLWEVDLHL